MRANLQREIAAAALGGSVGTEPVAALIRKGLSVLHATRRALRDAGLVEAVRARTAAKAGRNYIRAALPRGAHVRLHLSPAEALSGPTLLLVIHPTRGRLRRYTDPALGAAELARLVGTDVEAATRVLLGIERARRRCYELSEEATRWL